MWINQISPRYRLTSWDLNEFECSPWVCFLALSLGQCTYSNYFLWVVPWCAWLMNSVDHRMTYQDRYGYYPTTPIVILRCSASFLLLLPRQAMYQGLQANLAVYYAKARLVDWVVGGAAMADSGWHAWYVSGVAAWLCIICHEHCILHMGKMWQATVPNPS